MKRVAICVLFVLVGSVSAQEASNLWPDFGKGKTGDFVHTKGRTIKAKGKVKEKVIPPRYLQITVEEVVDKETLLCKLGDKPPFLVTKYPHSDVVDDAVIELKGTWKCVGTKKHGGRTVFVIEPVK